jgi:hypothetical protein
MKRVSATILLTVGLVFGTLMALAGPASAATTSKHMSDCYPGGSLKGCTSSVHHVHHASSDPTGHAHHSAPSTGSRTSTPSHTATPVVDSQPVASGSLAFTGVDALAVGLVGFALIGGGVVLIRVTRKRQTA